MKTAQKPAPVKPSPDATDEEKQQYAADLAAWELSKEEKVSFLKRQFTILGFAVPMVVPVLVAAFAVAYIYAYGVPTQLQGVLAGNRYVSPTRHNLVVPLGPTDPRFDNLGFFERWSLRRALARGGYSSMTVEQPAFGAGPAKVVGDTIVHIPRSSGEQLFVLGRDGKLYKVAPTTATVK